MTPKEKAKELVESFIPYADRHLYFKKLATYVPSEEHQLDSAKQCALIAVNEIIKSNPIMPLEFMLESEALDAANEYWTEVKKEIEK